MKMIYIYKYMPTGMNHMQSRYIPLEALPEYLYCAANKCHRYRIFDYDILFLFYIFHVFWLYTCVIICNWLMFGFVVREISFCSIVFDATWVPWRQKSESYQLVVQQHALARNKINIQTLSHWKRNLSNKLFMNFWDYPRRCDGIS